jgi:hypothetical protein
MFKRHSPIDAFYTLSEKTDSKYTVGFALASAKRQLSARKFRGAVCVNAIAGRALSEKITLREVNEIAERLVYDSLRNS